MRAITRITTAAVLSSAMLGNVNAQLDVFHGNKLKRFCDDFDTDAFGMYGATCLGYVNGVVDALASVSLFCLPEGVSREQIALVVKKYLAEHPEKLHIEADILVVRALEAAFSCTDSTRD